MMQYIHTTYDMYAIKHNSLIYPVYVIYKYYCTNKRSLIHSICCIQHHCCAGVHSISHGGSHLLFGLYASTKMRPETHHGLVEKGEHLLSPFGRCAGGLKGVEVRGGQN